MLTRSLCCFHGLSLAAERRLWHAGCLKWDYLPRVGSILSQRKSDSLVEQIPEMRAALAGRVADFFIKRLPPGHRMRVWSDFMAGVAFMDVETTGLSGKDDLTIIGLWQAGQTYSFVRGQNLPAFLGIFRNIEVLVTFNGIRFDWPVVARTFGLACMPPHIDLMDEARAYGYVGGLKKIEKALGIKRSVEEEGDGKEAIRLWRLHISTPNDVIHLKKLLLYNTADVRSLLLLSRIILRRSFDGFPASVPDLPPTPYGFCSAL